MHIMIVDDEEDIQLLFKQRFRKEIRTNQLTLSFAFSGEEALDYLAQQDMGHITLILSDINMPGMNGLELLKNIKARFVHIKVFMITAYDDEHNYHTAMQYGADDYITKPVSFDELKHKIWAM